MICGSLEMMWSKAKDFQSADSHKPTAAVNREQILFPYVSDLRSLDRMDHMGENTGPKSCFFFLIHFPLSKSHNLRLQLAIYSSNPSKEKAGMVNIEDSDL